MGSVSARGRAVHPSTSSLQKVFCGHEHTLGNLEFAQKVEPYNDHVKAKLSWAKVWPLLHSQWQGWRVGQAGARTAPSVCVGGGVSAVTSGLGDQAWLGWGFHPF